MKRIKLEEWPFETVFTGRDFPADYHGRKYNPDEEVRRRFRFQVEPDRMFGAIIVVEYADKATRLWTNGSKWGDPKFEVLYQKSEDGTLVYGITFAPQIHMLMCDMADRWDQEKGPEGFTGNRLCFPVLIPEDFPLGRQHIERALEEAQAKMLARLRRNIASEAADLARKTRRLERLMEAGQA